MQFSHVHGLVPVLTLPTEHCSYCTQDIHVCLGLEELNRDFFFSVILKIALKVAFSLSSKVSPLK